MRCKRKRRDRKRTMKKLVYKVILPIVIFFLVAISPVIIAIAHANEKINYLETLVPNMINFIEDHTDYVYGGWDYPDIIINTQKEICAGVYAEPRPDCDVAGYYNDDTNTIYIRDSPTQHMVEDRFSEVVLVHELVHFLQYHDGTYEEVKCRQNLEKDAFMIQEKFVSLQNIDPKQAPDPLFALIVSSCPREMPFLMFPGEG